MNVGERQRRLSEMATQDPELVFKDLYGHLYSTEWLAVAHDKVKRNQGSITAGCDGIVMQEFDRNYQERMVELARELKARTFQPHPVRRVYIRKSHDKWRPLGIPSIRDRIVQEAIRMVLEPIFETDFYQYSYGFRPNRSTMSAVKCILTHSREHMKYFWIIEGDIKSYFDTIHHRKLLQILRRRIKDEKLPDLIHKNLKAGVMEGKLFKDTTEGTPQGGISSPLLANIYLNELDRYMDSHYNGRKNRRSRRQRGMSNYVHIRYADDFIVMCNGKHSEALAMKEELSQFLHSKLKLTLSDEKTRVTHVNDGYKFLGFEIVRCVGTKGTKTTKILIPKSAKESFKKKIAMATDKRSHNSSLKTKIMALNSIIRGWCNHYRYTSNANTDFRKLEHYVFWKVAHWVGRKYKMNMPDVLKKYYAKSTFHIEKLQLVQASSIKARRYPGLFVIPNPYLKNEEIVREDVTTGFRFWTGNESRPGVEDNRSWILMRDNYTCQKCGHGALDFSNCNIDHIKPVRKFRNALEANHIENLQTLCIPCHRQKTKSELQGENLVR